MTVPKRGEIWTVSNAEPEEADENGSESAVVISADLFNAGPSGLIVTIPVARSSGKIPWHVPVELEPKSGRAASEVLQCDRPRTLSRAMLRERVGVIPPAVLERSERRLFDLLDL